MWKIDHAREIGSSHETKNQPCQDNVSSLADENGKWHSICVSDGAGSSKHSEISSKIVSEQFSRSMLQIGLMISELGPGSWVNDKIISELLELRRNIKKETGADELNDYHATLVALLIGEHASIAVQIGDGAIFAGKTGDNPEGEPCLNSEIFVSLPENGEYKNETYFITEPHWIKHIRISVFGKIDWFAMGTDGGIDTLCDREELNSEILARLLEGISQTETGKSIVEDHITSEDSRARTGDDITCAVGIFEPSFAGMPPKWDPQLSSPIYLDPDSRAEVPPLENVPIQPSVNTTQSSSNSPNQMHSRPRHHVVRSSKKKAVVALVVALLLATLLVLTLQDIKPVIKQLWEDYRSPVSELNVHGPSIEKVYSPDLVETEDPSEITQTEEPPVDEAAPSGSATFSETSEDVYQPKVENSPDPSETLQGEQPNINGVAVSTSASLLDGSVVQEQNAELKESAELDAEKTNTETATKAEQPAVEQ